MNRKGVVYCFDKKAGLLEETDFGYSFQYYEEYLAQDSPLAVSLTLPLKIDAYQSSSLFSFFDGLIPEGWLLNIAQKNWKINQQDRFGLLLALCKDCIGAVSVEELKQ